MTGAVTAGLVAVLGAVWVLLVRAYRRQRAALASSAPVTPPAPAAPQDPAAVGTRRLAADGDFAGTAPTGTWAPGRVSGDVRGTVAMTVGTGGVCVERAGDAALVVPAGSLRAVRDEAGVVLLTWEYGGDLLDTGFRPSDGAATGPLVAAVAALLPPPRTRGEPTGSRGSDEAAAPGTPVLFDLLDRPVDGGPR